MSACREIAVSIIKGMQNHSNYGKIFCKSYPYSQKLMIYNNNGIHDELILS